MTLLPDEFPLRRRSALPWPTSSDRWTTIERRIGMELLERAEGRAVLGAGGRRLLELEERPGARRDPQAADLFHFALLLPSRAALGRRLAQLIETETDLTGASDHA